ncbi:MAG: hypothetical protein LBW85_10280 [Deltaproteobacteria bacterium]|jgi:hypothetical protein|nr:hypothetical protein [Deltaproteobacteria bacterium]
MSSRTILNLTPEQRKILEEARRLRQEAERQLSEAVAKALEKREARVRELLERHRAETAREALGRLRGSGALATADSGSPGGGPEPDPAAEARDVIARCRAFYAEVKDISPEAASALDSLMGELDEGMDPYRLDLILDSVRAALSKEVSVSVRTERHREELRGFLAARPSGQAGDEFVRRINAMLAKRRVRSEDMEPVRADYLALREADRAAEESLALMRRTREKLSEQGYHMLDAKGRPVSEGFPLARDGVYYFAGANPDYRVRCQVDRQGALNLQQMRVVASKEELKAMASAYKQAVEREESDKWCAAQKGLVESMGREGVKVAFSVSREAGIGPLPVLIDKSKEKFGKIAQALDKAGRPAALEAAPETAKK